MKFKRSFFLIFVSFMLFLSTTVFAADIQEDKNYFFLKDGAQNESDVFAQQSAPVTEAEAYQRMIALKLQYPEGLYWTNDNAYISQGRLSDGTGLGGYGCHAFALILSDAAFGSAPFYEHNDINQVRVGDILRVYNNTHTVIVLEVHPDSFVVAEGNYNSSIHWGRTISKADLTTDFIWTRYSSVSTPIPQPDTNANQVSIYRLYNPLTGEHLYTSDYGEMVILVLQHGWNEEGVGWYAPISGEPVYRLYNPVLDDHLYTSSQEEKNLLSLNYGWSVDNQGNPLFYTGGSKPVYRLYNPLLSRHLLTISEDENNILIQSQGWNSEGIALYCLN